MSLGLKMQYKILSRTLNSACSFKTWNRLIRSSSHQCSEKMYDTVFPKSITKPDDFWAEAAEGIHWFKKWDRVLDQSNNPFTKWFIGGELNTCFNAIDRHVHQGRGQQTAIIHDSPVTNSITHMSYNELLEQVEKFAGALRHYGVEKGDRVLIYMPMIPQAIVAMMASARIGAIHSLVFGGFAAKELSTRIAHAEAKIVISANFGIEPTRNVPYKPLLDEALSLIEFKPKKCIIFNRPGFDEAKLKVGMDVDWNEALNVGSPAECVPVPATDPVYLLYTSGTTGLPKAVVRPSGGHAVAMNWTMKNVYGMDPGQVWWSASDLGWVVGHSYIAYSPLISGCTTILYEGKPVGTPDAGAFFRVLHQHQVRGMFTAPTAIRAIRAADPEGNCAKQYLPLDKFQALFVAGEHCDYETMDWIKSLLNKPILDNWWQTETGWPMTATCMGLGMDLNPPPATTGKPVPGWNVQVLNDEAKETEPGELGHIYVKDLSEQACQCLQVIFRLPLPPGSLSTLWNADERFENTYFSTLQGYYDTMDSGVRDNKGYISVLSRSDDVINVAGHRLSCGSIEEAILECHDVIESAVIGVPDSLKGHLPVGLCVINPDSSKSHEEIQNEVVQTVRNVIGPVAAFKIVVIVPKLPKTRSGKIPRSTIAAIAAGEPYNIPGTIEDETVYPSIEASLRAVGLPPSKEGNRHIIN